MEALNQLGLRINANRLWKRHEAMGAIGAIEGGGSCRPCLSSEDGDARDLFKHWCEQAGLVVRIDRVGNMFGIRTGADTSLPLILSGSHLDTQPHGGRFDGVSGVLCALEVLETLNDHNVQTSASLAVVNWTNEEGVRFGPGLMGSSWFVGAMTEQQVHESVAEDGARFVDDARRLGYLGDSLAQDFSIGAFFELHIEQGPVLENEGVQIGVVESVQGLRWLDVEVSGVDAHAGTTPLEHRHDTVLASADMIVKLHELGLQYSPHARVTVGRLQPATDAASTIAGKTRFVVDIRHPDADTLETLMQACRNVCLESGKLRRCEVNASQRFAIAPSRFDEVCVSTVADAAAALGYQSRRMNSGALHDASNLSAIAPSAMIFIPCEKGISHSVEERASAEDLEAGCNVLLQTLLATSAGPLER